MTRRIALISEHASPNANLGSVDSGGQNLYVGQVAKILASRNWRVDVFTRRDSDQLPSSVNWINGVRIIHVPAGPAAFIPKESLLPYMSEFRDNIIRYFHRQSEPYNLTHAHFWMSAQVSTEIKRRLHIPFVVSFHALGRVRREYQREADGFPDERFAIEEHAIRQADRIIAVCPQDQWDLRRLYGADPKKITIVPCGFDIDELRPMNKVLAKLALGFRSDDRVILHVGRLVPRKGIDTVICAAGHLQRIHGINARLLIVGGSSENPEEDLSPEMVRLRLIAKAECTSDSVLFQGRRNRDSLLTYYNAADVFVSTPWYEPFGITPVEAMACGTPVIGSAVGGIKFSVKDGETGFLVPPRDPIAVAYRLALLYHDSSLYRKLARRASQRAQKIFTWSKVVTSLERVYEDVIRNTPLPLRIRRTVAV